MYNQKIIWQLSLASYISKTIVCIAILRFISDIIKRSLSKYALIFVGGAQIIDMMILVVDIVKGMQTQTAECLVIGEILCEKMVVVLNKVDLIEQAKRQSTVEKVPIIHQSFFNLFTIRQMIFACCKESTSSPKLLL